MRVGPVDIDTAGTREAGAEFRFAVVSNPHGLVRRPRQGARAGSAGA